MNDRTLREIRDRLTAIAAMLALLVILACIVTGILAYWHLKADQLRGRLIRPDRPVSAPVTRSAGPSG